MTIEEKIEHLISLNGKYIDPRDVYDVIKFTEELLELTKHYADKDIWLSSIGSHLDDWYDYKGHNGYDGAKQLLEKWEIK